MLETNIGTELFHHYSFYTVTRYKQDTLNSLYRTENDLMFCPHFMDCSVLIGLFNHNCLNLNLRQNIRVSVVLPSLYLVRSVL